GGRRGAGADARPVGRGGGRRRDAARPGCGHRTGRVARDRRSRRAAAGGGRAPPRATRAGADRMTSAAALSTTPDPVEAAREAAALIPPGCELAAVFLSA